MDSSQGSIRIPTRTEYLFDGLSVGPSERYPLTRNEREGGPLTDN